MSVIQYQVCDGCGKRVLEKECECKLHMDNILGTAHYEFHDAKCLTTFVMNNCKRIKEVKK